MVCSKNLSTQHRASKCCPEHKVQGTCRGGRVITYKVTEDAEVYLLSIYGKGDYDTVGTRR